MAQVLGTLVRAVLCLLLAAYSPVTAVNSGPGFRVALTSKALAYCEFDHDVCMRVRAVVPIASTLGGLARN